MVIRQLFAPSSDPGNAILEDAQWTDDRAIDSSKQQGQRHQQQDDTYIQRQHGRQELDLGQTTPPGMTGTVKVQKQEVDQDKNGQRYKGSYLSHIHSPLPISSSPDSPAGDLPPAHDPGNVCTSPWHHQCHPVSECNYGTS